MASCRIKATPRSHGDLAPSALLRRLVSNTVRRAVSPASQSRHLCQLSWLFESFGARRRMSRPIVHAAFEIAMGKPDGQPIPDRMPAHAAVDNSIGSGMTRLVVPGRYTCRRGPPCGSPNRPLRRGHKLGLLPCHPGASAAILDPFSGPSRAGGAPTPSQPHGAESTMRRKSSVRTVWTWTRSRDGSGRTAARTARATSRASPPRTVCAACSGRDIWDRSREAGRLPRIAQSIQPAK
jgi:hypothetical protein